MRVISQAKLPCIDYLGIHRDLQSQKSLLFVVPHSAFPRAQYTLPLLCAVGAFLSLYYDCMYWVKTWADRFDLDGFEKEDFNAYIQRKRKTICKSINLIRLH